MSKDTIYREDAIKAINARTNWYQVTCNGKQIAVMLMAKDVNETLEKVPPADRPQGEWIIHKINGIPHTAECSCCHNHYDYEDLRRIGGIKEIIALPYCPDCGANMKGADDEKMDVL